MDREDSYENPALSRVFIASQCQLMAVGLNRYRGKGAWV